jgi:hypothetical protein
MSALSTVLAWEPVANAIYSLVVRRGGVRLYHRVDGVVHTHEWPSVRIGRLALTLRHRLVSNRAQEPFSTTFKPTREYVLIGGFASLTPDDRLQYHTAGSMRTLKVGEQQRVVYVNPVWGALVLEAVWDR